VACEFVAGWTPRGDREALEWKGAAAELESDTGEQLPSMQISRRIRAQIAADRLGGYELAERLGMTQRALAAATPARWSGGSTSCRSSRRCSG